MASWLVRGSESSGPGPGWAHCVVFLDKTRLCYSASLHTSLCKIKLDTGKLNSEGNLVMDYMLHPIQGGVAMFLVVPYMYYRNQEKLQPNGPLSSYADLTLITLLYLLIQILSK